MSRKHRIARAKVAPTPGVSGPSMEDVPPVNNAAASVSPTPPRPGPRMSTVARMEVEVDALTLPPAPAVVGARLDAPTLPPAPAVVGARLDALTLPPAPAVDGSAGAGAGMYAPTLPPTSAVDGSANTGDTDNTKVVEAPDVVITPVPKPRLARIGSMGPPTSIILNTTPNTTEVNHFI